MKKVAITLGSLFLLTLFVSPALALEIEIDKYGNMKFFEGYVLGEDTNRGRPSIQPISAPSGSTSTYSRRPTRQRPAGEDLVVTMEDEGPRVDVSEEDSTGMRRPRATMKSENLEMRFPARAKNLTEEQREKMSNYQEKIREARQERIQEMAELRERRGEGEDGLELKSRNVKAKLNGAEFILDTDSNEVQLTTPSGKVHYLTHLPDQALSRMKEAGVITEGNFDEDNQELEAVATEDGIEYTADISERKKFLSFFPRTVNKKIVLDDATGEVREDLSNKGWFGRMMDRFSY